MRYRNTSNEHRVWPTLRDAETGRTLTLPPGADAEVDGDVNDDRLVPVKQSRTSRIKPPVPPPNPLLAATADDLNEEN